MGGADKEHVARVVSSMSEGSTFHAHATAQAARTEAQIKAMLRRRDALASADADLGNAAAQAQLRAARRAVDTSVALLLRGDATRQEVQLAQPPGQQQQQQQQQQQVQQQHRTFVMLDMDMFFAAVEERDDPSLRGKPMAVGGLGICSPVTYQCFLSRSSTYSPLLLYCLFPSHLSTS